MGESIRLTPISMISIFYKNIMINATIRLFSYIYVRNGLSYIYEIKAPPTSLVLQSAIT